MVEYNVLRNYKSLWNRVEKIQVKIFGGLLKTPYRCSGNQNKNHDGFPNDINTNRHPHILKKKDYED